MSHPVINHAFYDAIVHFDESEDAKEYYYKIMNTEIIRNGKKVLVRDQILRAYAMLFFDDIGVEPGKPAGPDEVNLTADRLHTGTMAYDHEHWYRMQHHFPVIDEDNYERFAALVIADLNAGPLHDAAMSEGDTLLLGEVNSLEMTKEERAKQHVRVVTPGG